jgi:hypothetical protein
MGTNAPSPFLSYAMTRDFRHMQTTVYTIANIDQRVQTDEWMTPYPQM